MKRKHINRFAFGKIKWAIVVLACGNMEVSGTVAMWMAKK
jgi:hypothetical protein